jgi:hypothetical protein
MCDLSVNSGKKRKQDLQTKMIFIKYLSKI